MLRSLWLVNGNEAIASQPRSTALIKSTKAILKKKRLSIDLDELNVI